MKGRLPLATTWAIPFDSPHDWPTPLVNGRGFVTLKNLLTEGDERLYGAT
jgi:hypothetical protein